MPSSKVDSDAPLTALALVSTSDASTISRPAPPCRAAGRVLGINTPLILPDEEFRRSLDAFPLEYGEIIRAHVVLFGDDPFAGATIVREDLRRACETQVKSHLVHLRESFIETRGNPRAVGELVRTAAPAFAALLRNVARLMDVKVTDRLSDPRRSPTGRYPERCGVGGAGTRASVSASRCPTTPDSFPHI